MVLVAHQEMQGHDAGLRRQRRGVGRRGQAELDVACLHELQHLRFLAELGAGILVDQHRALAELLQLVGEDGGGDAVARADGLVVGDLVVLGLRVGAGRGERQAGGDEQRRCNATQECLGHVFPPQDQAERS